jgi:hypothetical protein
MQGIKNLKKLGIGYNIVKYNIDLNKEIRNTAKKFKFYQGLDKKPYYTRNEMRRFPLEEIDKRYPYGFFRTSSCGRNSFVFARPLETSRFDRMAECFRYVSEWKPGKKWIKITSRNCVDNMLPLNKYDHKEKDVVTIIPPMNILSAPRSEIKKIHDIIIKANADLIHANPTYLKLLLYRFFLEKLKLKRKFNIVSTYELLLDSTKKIIKDLIDCDIIDQYGCSEVGPITYQKNSYHIFQDSLKVALIPEKERKNIAKIIISDYENKVMPFVNYFTGDYALIKEGEDRIIRIAGREEEKMEHDGKLLFPIDLDEKIKGLDILHYQLDLTTNTLKIIPYKKRRVKGEKSIGFGKIKIVDEILPIRNGKFVIIKK